MATDGPPSRPASLWRRGRGLRRGLLVALVLLVAATLPAAGAVPAEDAETTFLVAVSESGDATVTLRFAFDGSTEADRAAIERLEANRSRLVSSFESGMAAIAARAGAETGREMSVSDARMDVRTSGDRALVDLTLTWRGLAAVDGQTLRVSAPFDDGFETPGRFVLKAPEGHVVESVTPAATTRADDEVAWAAGTRLDGFEATIRPAGSAAGSSMPLPGFGVPAAVAAVAIVAGLGLWATRRRS